jgi:hypothetical protein
MKMLIGLIGAACMLSGTTALADSPCEKCTHDIQVQYRACRQSGKDQATCSQEGQARAQACVVTCQKKEPEGKQ